MAEEYRGALGAIPYAFRSSDSWLFRSYVVVGGLAAGLIALLIALALVVLFGQTAGFEGGTLTLSRTFYVVFGLFLFAPLIGPMLFVARRHRRAGGSARYDRWMALAGYVFLGSLYAGAIASMPASYQQAPTGLLAPVIAALYAIPPAFAFVVPLVAAVGILAVHYAAP
ncbi:MAG: hypothetical protein ABEJ74_06800 [Haloferacaceae archaeon]